MAGLSDQRRILIESQFSNQKKSVGIAYFLLIFTGVGRNFYLERPGRGILQFALIFVLIGMIWIAFDIFTLAGTVKSMNEDVYNRLKMKALREGSSDSGDFNALAKDPVIGAKLQANTEHDRIEPHFNVEKWRKSNPVVPR